MELESPVHDSGLFRAMVKGWLRKFKSGDLSCSDETRTGRSLTILGPVFKRFPDKHLFACVKVMSRHFDIFRQTLNGILRHELGLK
jgi:hypothetical protein